MQKEKIVVMAFGTFDYFHAGHEFYLKEAKKLGEELIVIIARDKTVRQIKGKNPTNSERARLKSIKNAGIADKVILGNLADKYRVIKKYKPNIIALGYDQFAFTQMLKKIIIEMKLDTQICRIDPHFPDVFKSSIINKRHQS